MLLWSQPEIIWQHYLALRVKLSTVQSILNTRTSAVNFFLPENFWLFSDLMWSQPYLRTARNHLARFFDLNSVSVCDGWRYISPTKISKSTSFWATMFGDHSFYRFCWAEFIAAVFGKIWRRQSGLIGTNWFLLIIQLMQLDHFAASKSSQIKRQWTQLNKTCKMSGFPTL